MKYHELGETRPIRRSLIEVPCNIPKMLAKSETFPVDILMLDLEDSVPATDEAKTEARANIRAALETQTFAARELVVRVNRPGHRWCMEDLAFVCSVADRLSGIVLPKTYTLEEYTFIEHYLDLIGAPESLMIHLIIETPGSLVALPAIADKARRLTSIIAGGFDYSLEIGSTSLLLNESGRFEEEQLLLNRQMVLAVARTHGLSALDGQLVSNPRDDDEIESAALRSRRMGFDGGALYHPNQVTVCNRMYAPSANEVEWAEQVIAAMEGAHAVDRAAVMVEGRAVLPQHHKLAAQILAVTEQLDLDRESKAVPA